MKFIKPKVEYLPQSEGIKGIYKQIEYCARTCYKSEDNITDNSAVKFVKKLIENKHIAMLEHSAVYLKIPTSYSSVLYVHLSNFYSLNPYSSVEYDEGVLYVTTSYRVIVENNLFDDLKYACEPTEFHEKRYTFKFTTDIGTARELTRHKILCVA